MRVARALPFLSLAFALCLFGCGGTRTADVPDARATLEEIQELYAQVRAARKGVPTRLADLQRYSPIAPTGMPALESGECVAIWGAGLAEGSNAVLVYEKGVPQNGGYVLLQDGSIRKMTAQEFQAAPRARK